MRSFEPTGTGRKRERALERLERLAATPAVESATVGVWGEGVEETRELDRVPQLRTVRRRLEAFDAWAERTERSLEPFFRRERVESTITGRTTDVRRLPTLALAEFAGDEVVHVAPCRDGDRTIDALDRLAAIEDEATSVVSFEGGERRDGATTSLDPPRSADADRTRLGPPEPR